MPLHPQNCNVQRNPAGYLSPRNDLRVTSGNGYMEGHEGEEILQMYQPHYHGRCAGHEDHSLTHDQQV
jgi:hypothetical protein